MTAMPRWLAIGVTGALLGMTLAFGSATVSADPGIAGGLGITECTRAGNCPKQDEFKAGDIVPTTDSPDDADTSNNAGTDTTTPDGSSAP